MVICDYEQCTGCCACMNICGKDAISMTADKYGKSIPQIDADKCVSCGACSKVCPINCPSEKRMPKTAYAVWSYNEEDKKHSSSGGVAAVMGRQIISQGGVVFGCAAVDGQVKHTAAHTMKEAEAFRGSKYVQSYAGLIYREVKACLKENKKVLFVGVPCQVAALYNYLGKEYDNLYTIDLICHGTPPIHYLEEHIKDAIGNKKWDSVSFRGRYDWKLTVFDKSNIRYQRDRHSDLYFRAFLDALIYRENCYQCSYACPERCADMTIGDFWGLDKSALRTQYDGNISLVLTNTEKGKNMLSECGSEFYIQERPLEEAMNEQQWNLLHPSVAPKDREVFLEMYPKVGFDKAVAHTEIGKKVKQTYRKSRFNNSLFGRLYNFAKRAISFVYRKVKSK